MTHDNNLTHQLDEYSKKDIYPLHMPGHKRQYKVLESLLPWQLDITEIASFDDLNHPTTTFRETEMLAAELFGSQKSYFLTNGSTGGILSAIQASCKMGDKILVARNCHQSVFHGIELKKLNPIFIYPEISPEFPVSGSISPDIIYDFLERNPEISTVIITSPTYDGVVSDIKSISTICHQFGANLIVDEAHGAHLGFNSYFPSSAVTEGADMVIQSLHKTLPSLTQTAILHVCSNRISGDEVHHAISLFHSTSPSYILSSSIVECIEFIHTNHEQYFEKYKFQLEQFYRETQQLNKLKILNPKDFEKKRDFAYNFDPGKIIIDCSDTSLSSRKLINLLREKYHLECEMSQPGYVLAMTSIMDTDEGFNRLKSALFDIDTHLTSIHKKNILTPNFSKTPEIIFPIHEAVESKWEKVSIDSSVGRVSAGYLYAYPPGIPVFVPGEKINSSVIELRNSNIELKSSLEAENGFICVLKIN